MSFAHLNITTGFVQKNDSFIGSSVIFPWKGELCAITAGHNFYGKSFKQKPDLAEWQIVDHSGQSHPVKEILGDIEFAKVHDIVLIKLDCMSDLTHFICPKFCGIPTNPKHSLLFRGRYNASGMAVTRKNITYNTNVAESSHHFLCDIEKALLVNDVYKSGSDWLGGWSGSGLFLDNHSELICAGIMCEIPNNGNDAQLLFSSVLALNEIGIDLEVIPASELDFDKRLNIASLNAILQSVDENAVNKWETDNQDSPQLIFLNRKLKEVYPEESVQLNKRRIIKQLLNGKSYLAAELSKNEQLLQLYNNAYRVYDLESKEVYVDNQQEARAGLTIIKKDYETYLSQSIGQEFSATDVKLLAAYGVSEWIADCSLDFLPNG
jgi:hypothetical protein